MRQDRNYNRVYIIGRLCLQILQEAQTRKHNGFIFEVIPSFGLVFCGRCLIVGCTFSWICGTLNFGIINRQFQEQERKRLEFMTNEARKMGITLKQYRLRFGW